MSFSKHIQKSIDKIIKNKVESYIDDLVNILPTNSNITKQQLLELWNKKQTKQPRKKSSYINWSTQARPKIKQQYPSLSFSEVAKKLGQMWKEMSQEERDKYKST